MHATFVAEALSVRAVMVPMGIASLASRRAVNVAVAYAVNASCCTFRRVAILIEVLGG